MRRRSSHEMAERTWRHRGHCAFLWSATLGSLVTGKNAVFVSRYRKRSDWATANTYECCRRQPSNAQTRVLWCGSSGSCRLRLLQWAMRVPALLLSVTQIISFTGRTTMRKLLIATTVIGAAVLT